MLVIQSLQWGKNFAGLFCPHDKNSNPHRQNQPVTFVHVQQVKPIIMLPFLSNTRFLALVVLATLLSATYAAPHPQVVVSLTSQQVLYIDPMIPQQDAVVVRSDPTNKPNA